MKESTEKPQSDALNGNAVRRLVRLLKDPAEEWEFDPFTAHHARTGIDVWIENIPVLDTNTYPVPMDIGLLAKWRIWRALKVARENYWRRKLVATPELPAEEANQ